MTEERIINETTGGEKGQKLDRFDLIPAESLRQIAHHFGVGAKKYADRNWERGYNWDLSYGALQRHLNAWWGGEDIDEETGSSHLAAAGFHVLALLEFERTHPELDTRPTTVSAIRERNDFLASMLSALGIAVEQATTPLIEVALAEPEPRCEGFCLACGDEPEPKYDEGDRVSVRDVMKAVDGTKMDVTRENGEVLTGQTVTFGGKRLHEDVVIFLDALEDAGFQVTKA